MKRIAIIPARGGSKRIPRKNIKDFQGKPIIAYSIETALISGLFDEVMVSTDDEEIAITSRQYGASVPFIRSAEASNDVASTAMVLHEVLKSYKESGQAFAHACCIYPTAPFVTPQRLSEAWELLLARGFDSVLPVVRYSYPIWRSVRLENGKARMHWQEHLNSRSQDLPAAYHDAGQFYWFNTESFLHQGTLFTPNTGAIELEEMEVQDIDNLKDWKLAELKYKLLKNSISQ
jgi:pseudaminic acid cytidylyltransferase